MKCLIRFAQTHESFRKPEIEALASLAGVDVEFLVYDDSSPYCIVEVADEAAARAIICRSILAQSIHELWGQGQTYDGLHADVRERTESKWQAYRDTSFKLILDSYGATRNVKQRNDIFNSLAYLGFLGPIKMKGADEKFTVFEEYDPDATIQRQRDPSLPPVEPQKVYFGRFIAEGSREVVNKHDLKKRTYISTTSMDAELSLITANMAHAGPGKIFYDPFVGTGSFCVAAAHFGAHVFGSDIDGRSFKGNRKNGKPIGLVSNLQQYHLESCYLDAFTSDLTNTPIRQDRLFDGIICDPPYGVREGLKVLGTNDERKKQIIYVNGVATHTMEGYIPPRKQYSFEAMLKDILEFAARTLVTGGRLSLWMPTANDEDIELDIPGHPHLEVVSVCIQPFNKWSRRLLTYRRLPEGEVSEYVSQRRVNEVKGVNADDLNTFRRKYFQTVKSSPSGSPSQTPTETPKNI